MGGNDDLDAQMIASVGLPTTAMHIHLQMISNTYRRIYGVVHMVGWPGLDTGYRHPVGDWWKQNTLSRSLYFLIGSLELVAYVEGLRSLIQ